MTSPIYDRLMSEVDDDLERQVLHVLLTHTGERASRQALVSAVFDIAVDPYVRVYNGGGKRAGKVLSGKVNASCGAVTTRPWPICALCPK
jgi:hypothetical protein